MATFHSPERLGYPPGKKQRERLLGRVDALTAVSDEAAAAAAARFPGDYRLLPRGVDPELFTTGKPRAPLRPRMARGGAPAPAGRVPRARASCPAGSSSCCGRRPLSGRPYVPRALRGRVTVRTALDARRARRGARGAAGLVPAARGTSASRWRQPRPACPLVDPPGSGEQPELVAAALARLAEDEAGAPVAPRRLAATAEGESFAELGDELERTSTGVMGKRRAAPARPPTRSPTARSILADLHMHTEHSHDCSVPVADLLDHAESIGLGAIAITDHNVFSGAQEAVELARGRDADRHPGRGGEDRRRAR